MDIRLKTVVLSLEGVRTDKEISASYSISERTLRRWKRAYVKGGIDGLRPLSTAPRTVKGRTPPSLERRILRLKQDYPAWGARRIKHQFDLPVHWRTVHRVIKRHGLLVRIKPKPQPCRRFQREHVDSMWQGDTFQFRIQGVGRVYVTGFTDDCSRYRVRSKAYTRKGAEEAVNALRWALRNGRKPRQIYLDNGRQFIAKGFKDTAKEHGIRLVFGRPYNPRGRGKIEAYHRALHRELVSLRTFTSLGHFRRELWAFDRRYNNWRKQEALGWQTPASVYNDERYFFEDMEIIEKRTNVLSTEPDIC